MNNVFSIVPKQFQDIEFESIIHYEGVFNH